MIIQGVLLGTPAMHAAGLLKDELERQGVESDVHDGYGLALISVWADLVVWTDGMVYRWWAGRVSSRTGGGSTRSTAWATRPPPHAGWHSATPNSGTATRAPN
ncbi:hypothetical protein ACFQX6_02125 [Streptosporangium lutulentum]